MPLLKDEYSPIDDAISYGAIGEFAWVQIAGFFALAAGTTILAALLAIEARAQQVVVALLAISAAAVIVLAVFPIDGHGEDTSMIGSIHSAAAAVAFVTTVAAMLCSSRSFSRNEAVAGLAPASLALGGAAAILLIALTAEVGPTGLVQRATVACEIAWLSAVALQLHQSTSRAARPLRSFGQSR